jgi:hypothetical protein
MVSKDAVTEFGGSAEQVAGELAGFAQILKAQPKYQGLVQELVPGADR